MPSTVPGMLTGLNDSDAGSFTASYDADGSLASKTYPNGLRADFTYDEVGAGTGLAYTKESNCSQDCVWFEEQVSESVHGQWTTHGSSLSAQGYSYDRAGRLTGVRDTVAGQCATRAYGYDANSNRTAMTAYQPGSGGACSTTSGSTSQASVYDGADRIANEGFEYDSFGRTTRVPASHAGGGPIDYSYYINDMVASISQDGVSKAYTLDPAGRQRQSIPGGGTNHVEKLLYTDGSDSPAIALTVDGQGAGVNATRQIEGIDGDLAAIRTLDYQAQTNETVLQLSNLHGDTIATASLDPQAPALLDTFESDEFGNPRQTAGTDKRYGWLGAKQRRTELASGVIQMGVRSYVPAMGRFTSVDPVVGGSANDYDYTNADPVNGLDLDGRQARWRNPWAMFNEFLNHGVEKKAKEGAKDIANAGWDCGKSATFNFIRTRSWQKALISCVGGGIRGAVKRSGWWAKFKFRIREGDYNPRKTTCYWTGKRSKCRRSVRGDFGR